MSIQCFQVALGGSNFLQKSCKEWFWRVHSNGTVPWSVGEFYMPSLAIRQKAMKWFTCNFEIVCLQTELWTIVGFQYLLNFCMVHKKVLIYNANCHSSRDLRSYVPWKRMGLSSVNMTVTFWPQTLLSESKLDVRLGIFSDCGLVQRRAEDLWLKWL